MGTCLTLILLTGLILSASAVDHGLARSQDLAVALEEMQDANYFAFVMLIKMLQQDRIPGNITFLMPNDRMLSNISVHETAVHEFLMRHSIPMPLLFDHLKHFPTRSIIPTNNPDFMLRVTNGGRRRFCLNNVRIISPNVCTVGSSIRCHGIDGVLSMTTDPEHNITLPSSSCYAVSHPPPHGPPTPISSPTPTPPPIPSSPTPASNISPTPPKSDSSDVLHAGLFSAITSCLVVLLLFKFQI